MPAFAWQKEEYSADPGARKYPEELLERATRLVFQSGRPIAHVGRDLGIAPETLRKYVRRVDAYYERATGRRSARRVEDERLLAKISALHEANYLAYGSRRMWKALLRAGEQVGRDRVARLMRQNAIQGAKRRGKPWRTTRPDPRAQRSPDLVEGVRGLPA